MLRSYEAGIWSSDQRDEALPPPVPVVGEAEYFELQVLSACFLQDFALLDTGHTGSCGMVFKTRCVNPGIADRNKPYALKGTWL